MEKKWIAYPENRWGVIRHNKHTEQRAADACTYKCTALEDGECDCMSTTEMM